MDDVKDIAIIIAIVEALKEVVPSRLGGIVTIVVAVTVGTLLGFARTRDAWQGLIKGFVAVGSVTAARQFNR